MDITDVWGSLVSWDFFFGGTGAGAFLVLVLFSHFHKQKLEKEYSDSCEGYQFFMKAGLIFAPISVALGGILIILDLGNPAGFLYTFSKPFSSVMSGGTYLTTIFIVFAALYLYHRTGNKKLGVFGEVSYAIAILAAIGVVLYPGFLLGKAAVRPLWANGALPLNFMFSALLCGIGALGLLMAIKYHNKESVQLKFLNKATVGLLLLQVISGVILLVSTYNSGLTGQEAVGLLLSDYVFFWVGVVVLGLIIPVILGIDQMRSKRYQFGVKTIVLSACLLLEGICLRALVLSGGFMLPL